MRFHVRIAVGGALLLASVALAQQTPRTSLTAIPSPLTLAQAEVILLQASPAIRAEAQAIPSAKADIEAASKFNNPTFAINSESYPAFSAQPGSYLNNQELNATVSQTVLTASKRHKRVDVAKRALAVAGSNLANFNRQLRQELRQRYWSAALAASQAKLARVMLSQFDETLKLNEERYKQGEISGLERTRLQTERLRFWNDVQQADLDLQNAKASLLELMAAPQDTPFELGDSLQTSVPIIPVAELIAQALVERPDLAAQQQSLEQRQSELKYQHSLAVPDVTVAAGYKRNFGVDSPVVNVQVPLPIFNRNQGGIHGAEADVTRQQQLLQKLEFQVEREVQQAANTLATQQRRAIEIRDVYAPSAQKALDIAIQSYRLGSLDLIQLLDAERVYRDTQRTANQAYFDLRLAESSLVAATGKELFQ